MQPLHSAQMKPGDHVYIWCHISRQWNTGPDNHASGERVLEIALCVGKFKELRMSKTEKKKVGVR